MARPLERTAALEAFRKQNRPGEVAFGVGIVIAEGQTATFESSAKRPCVIGVAPVPSPKARRPYRFVLHKTRAGLSFKARLTREDQALIVTTHCRLADPPLFVEEKKSMLSVRQPATGTAMAEYLFNQSLQHIGEGNMAITVDKHQTWQLSVPWRFETNGVPGKSAAGTQRAIMFSLRQVHQLASQEDSAASKRDKTTPRQP